MLVEIKLAFPEWVATFPAAYYFAVGGVVATFIGFVTCNARANKISTASWLLWLVGDAAEAGTFFDMTGEDALKSAVPIMFACGTLTTCLLAFRRNRFDMPDNLDWGVVIVDLAISASWWQKFLTAAQANITLVFTEILSFIPLYRGILTGREREYPMTWVWWTLGDACFLGVILSLIHTQEETIFPIVQMIAHALVLVCLAIRRIREEAP